MKRIFTSCLLVAAVSLSNLAACDCIFIPNFCESITFGNNGQIVNDLSIHRIKVNSKLSNGVEISVLQTYSGENLVGHDLTIQNGSGADCILIASQFLEEGKEYIIGSSGNSTTITLGECGVYYLKVENGMVQGAIAPGIDEVALSDFPNIGDCGDLNPALVVAPGVIGSLVIRPTLVTDASTEVEIRTLSFSEFADLNVAVYDLAGRLVQSQFLPDFGFYSQVKINIGQWAAGTYFVSVLAGEERKVVKVVRH